MQLTILWQKRLPNASKDKVVHLRYMEELMSINGVKNLLPLAQEVEQQFEFDHLLLH